MSQEDWGRAVEQIPDQLRGSYHQAWREAVLGKQIWLSALFTLASLVFLSAHVCWGRRVVFHSVFLAVCSLL